MNTQFVRQFNNTIESSVLSMTVAYCGSGCGSLGWSTKTNLSNEGTEI